MRLYITYLDTPWCIASRSSSAKGGGWASVRALQANNLWKYRCQARWAWKPNPERAVKIEHGVLIEKRTDGGEWLPYCKLELLP